MFICVDNTGIQCFLLAQRQRQGVRRSHLHDSPFFVTCIFSSHLDQGFGDKQTEHCCPGLHGGPQQKTSMRGNQVEERPRTVLVFISMTALSLASGQMTPALNRIIMFVKQGSE